MKSDWAVDCQNLTLGYGRDAVLENVTLRIPKGVFLPFVGPNGAGKTTFLRAILGFVKPISGQLISSFEKCPAGYVAQHKTIDSLFPVTVREIVAMGLYPRLGWWKKPDKQQVQEIDESLSELKLLPYQNKNYRDLSGGTKQKVLIARALVSGAEIYIMDEPASELEESSEREVFAHLKRFVKEQGKTVLLAHHGLSRILESETDEVCIVRNKKMEIKKMAEFSSGRLF